MKPVLTDRGGYRSYGYKLNNKYHPAHDYNCNLNEEVYSVAPGIILLSSQDRKGFGGYNPSMRGGVVIIQHTNKKGDPFIAIYGHIESDMIEGEPVERGQRIGHVHQYTASGIKLPHLHFCISLADWATVRKSKWGYVSDMKKAGWTNPKNYLIEYC